MHYKFSPPTKRSLTEEPELVETPKRFSFEPRQPKKIVSRLLGPHVTGAECSKTEHKSPVFQLSASHNPQTLLIAPKTRNAVKLTEEGLDDWFAQSQNRKIESLVLAKKDFYVPLSITEGIRTRWGQKPRPFQIETSELKEGQERKYFSLYHDQKKLSPRLILQEPTKLLFDFSKLHPKNVENGTTVRNHPSIVHHQGQYKRRTSRMYDNHSQYKYNSKGSHSNSPVKVYGTPKKGYIRIDDNRSLDEEDLPVNQEQSDLVHPSIEYNGSVADSMYKERKSFCVGNSSLEIPKDYRYMTRRDISRGSERPVSRYKGNSHPIRIIISNFDEMNTMKSQPPQSRDTADLLKEEEMIKEDEEFLENIKEKLAKLKNMENYTDRSPSILIDEHGNTFNTKLSPLSSPRKRSDFMFNGKTFNNLDTIESTAPTNKEQTFARLKEKIKAKNQCKIDDKKVQKLLPLEYREESPTKEQRNMSAQPVTSRKFSKTPKIKRNIAAHKDSNLLNRSINIVPSGNGSREVYTSPSERSPRKKKQGFLIEPKPTSSWNFSREAKTKFVEKFFNNCESPDLSFRKTDLSSFSQDEVLYHSNQFSLLKGYNNFNNRKHSDRTQSPASLLRTEEDQSPKLNAIAVKNLNLKLEILKPRLTTELSKGSRRRQVSIPKESPIKDSPTKSLGEMRKAVEFWFIRGTMQMDKENFYNAIDCFKQVLIINPQYYLCIFNIGCMYERLGNYHAAKRWLQVCLDTGFCKIECLYGLALCSLKLEDPKSCYDYLMQMKDQGEVVETNVEYLYAICSKELGNLEQATEYYLKVHEKIQRKTAYELATKVFSNLLHKAQNIQQENEAKDVTNFFENSLRFLVKKEITYVFDEFYTQEKEGKEWKSDYLEKVAQKMSTMKFWKRFPMEYLITFLGYMVIEKFKAGTIFYLREGYVFLIIAGAIALRDHSKGFLSPQTIAYFQEGDVLGFDKIDQGITKKLENWMICHSDLELWVIAKEDFEKIWETQNTLSRNVYKDHIQETLLFQNISLQTLYTISYEVARRESHPSGRVIYNDNTYMTAQEFNARVKSKVIEARFQDVLTNDAQPIKTGNSRAKKSFYPKNKSLLRPYRTPIITESTEVSLTEVNEGGNGSKFEKTTARGIFIILSGECTVENLQGNVITTLTRGDFFGENQLLETKAYNNFGFIKCKTETVEFLYIPKEEFWRIPKYDVMKMVENCQNRKGIKDIALVAENLKKSRRELL